MKRSSEPTKIQHYLVSPTKYDWTNVANSIVKGCYMPYDKARAIYVWMAEHIQYDTSYTIYDADTAWNKNKGVCQAYCELFYRLGSALGMDVRIITGHGRGRENYKRVIEDHCWIVVNKDPYPVNPSPFPEVIIYEKGQENKANIQITQGLNRSNAIFIEPTWGAGAVENGNFVKSDHDMSWFDVDPCWMIFTHYPKNPLDQMLGNYILSLEDYKHLPYLHPSYVEYGFEGTDLLSYFIHTNSCDFPKIYANFGNSIEFVDIPIASRLSLNEKYTICVIKKRECHLAIVNGNDYMIDDEQNTQWKQNGAQWNVTFIPKRRGTLSLSIRDDKNDILYHCILEYKIK
jgi:transglutaminase/protease-like cytokinesis protein 3